MSQQKGEKAVLPNKKISDFQIRESEYSVIDISYAELPEKPTGRINLSNILGTFAFLAMLAAPGAVEGEMYITAAALVGICAVCARLSIREEGKRK